MSLRVLFLGTAGSVPTPRRSLPAIVIKRKGELLFFDCGEGVQRQMILAGVSFHKKTKIFVTHLHGDHVLGLPGLLQTMSLMDRTRRLEIYGPPPIEAFVDAIQRTVQYNLTFPLEISEIEDANLVCEEREYEIHAVWADHVVPSLAYALIEKPRPGRFNPDRARELGVPEGPLWSKLQHGSAIRLPDGRVVRSEEVVGPLRPGRKIVYSGDTRPLESVVQLAKEADLLIHDGTLDDELADKAYEDGHSTASQAAEIAKKARVKRLILTHISARYKDAKILAEQARRVFPKTDVAEDFMEIELPLRDS
jgi:ribonuclease Z